MKRLIKRLTEFVKNIRYKNSKFKEPYYIKKCNNVEASYTCKYAIIDKNECEDYCLYCSKKEEK